MSLERSGNRYTGPKLFPDSREVIFDTPIAELDQGAQKVYLEGGYHSLVNQFMSVNGSVNNLIAEEQAFLRNRLTRELIYCTAGAHKDEDAVISLIKYFDRKSEAGQFLQIAQLARRLAKSYALSK